jgi:hypothetical protein
MSDAYITNRIDKSFFTACRLVGANKPSEIRRDCGNTLLNGLHRETSLFQMPYVIFQRSGINERRRQDSCSQKMSDGMVKICTTGSSRDVTASQRSHMTLSIKARGIVLLMLRRGLSAHATKVPLRAYVMSASHQPSVLATHPLTSKRPRDTAVATTLFAVSIAISSMLCGPRPMA